MKELVFSNICKSVIPPSKRLRNFNNSERFNLIKQILSSSIGFYASKKEKLKLFENFNLTIKPGEIVGLSGLKDSGQSILLGMLTQNIPLDSGSIEYSGSIASKLNTYE